MGALMAVEPASPHLVNPLRLHRELERQYRRFYDSAYAFADEMLEKERSSLLEKSGLSADLILEPVPGFKGSGLTLPQLAAELELGDDVAEFVSPLMNNKELHSHQAQALREYEQSKNF